MSEPNSNSINLLQRMVDAAVQVRERLLRTTRALHSANIPYAVIGGNAAAAWVATVDPGAVRNTPDVDILVRRSDVAAVHAALESAGFVYSNHAADGLYLDGVRASRRQAVRLAFAEEIVKLGESVANPRVEESTVLDGLRVINLDALIRMKLTAHRIKDRVHVRDMIDVGLVDQAWVDKLQPYLADRLQVLIDTPDG